MGLAGQPKQMPRSQVYRDLPRSRFPFLPRWLVCHGGSVSLALLSGIWGFSLHGAQGHSLGVSGGLGSDRTRASATCTAHPTRHPTEPSSNPLALGSAPGQMRLGPHLVGDQQPAHPPRGAGRLSLAEAALILKGSCTAIWGSHMCPLPQEPSGCLVRPLRSPGISGRRGRCPTLASGR